MPNRQAMLGLTVVSVLIACFSGATGAGEDGSIRPPGDSGETSPEDRGVIPAPADGGSGTLPVGLTKFDLLSAGAGSTIQQQLCATAGAPTDCDVCTTAGFLGDYECDQSLIDAGLCVGPDPDCSLAGGTYFVATDGNDANDGSEARPFATIQHAHDVAEPGDILVIRGGTYTPNDETRFTRRGSEDRPIILRSAPGEQVVIDGSRIGEGNTESASTPTWNFDGAQYWKIYGPLHLTRGRGAGVLIEGETRDVDFVFIESSYNGQSAARGGHGFGIVEEQWASVQNLRFINCDAHHNANHRIKSGDNVAEDLYQHGDGWRIKSGENVRLIGCRSWNNLDDNYDLVWAKHPVVLLRCWSGFAGRDDAGGTITGTPGFEAAWGEGIKLGYSGDTGPHRAIRCLSWKNVHLGFRMDGGPYELRNCASFENGRRALGWNLGSSTNVLENCLDLNTPRASEIPATTLSSHNSWDPDSSFSVTADDFVSLDDSLLLGPRSPDGSLPVVSFMRLVPGSDLIDAGLPGDIDANGSAPDIGCFEHY